MTDQPTGPALDAAMAELVGLKPAGHDGTGSLVWSRNGVTITNWQPSVNIAQAWNVWLEAKRRYGVLAVTEALELVRYGAGPRRRSLDAYDVIELLSPETICRAALRLVETKP